MQQLETKALLLRPIQIDDCQQVFEYRSDDISNKFQGFVPRSFAEVTEFISKNPTEFNQYGTWFQMVIIQKSDQKIVERIMNKKE